MLLENNQHQGGNSNSALYQATSHYTVIDYLRITEQPPNDLLFTKQSVFITDLLLDGHSS